jgi:hypothetical protein
MLWLLFRRRQLHACQMVHVLVHACDCSCVRAVPVLQRTWPQKSPPTVAASGVFGGAFVTGLARKVRGTQLLFRPPWSDLQWGTVHTCGRCGQHLVSQMICQLTDCDAVLCKAALGISLSVMLYYP